MKEKKKKKKRKKGKYRKESPHIFSLGDER